MPTTENSRLELAQFLKTQRQRLRPEVIGLAPRARRRVNGLRREEVAELADISVTWYAWLEQAREIHVSPQALDRIAQALRCSDEERTYLFRLAGENPPSTRLSSNSLPANLELVLDGLNPYPAYVRNSHYDIAAWNAGAASVFGDFAQHPEQSRNLLWLLFTDPSMQELFADWERFARCVLAWFRSAYGQSTDNPKWTSLVASLMRTNAQFRSWWALHEIATPSNWTKHLRHREGSLWLDPITLALGPGSDLSLIVFTPAPGTETAERLKLLSAKRDVQAQANKPHGGGSLARQPHVSERS